MTANRIRENRLSGMIGRPVETLAMEKAKRARKAETPKQPSLRLRLSAPHFYPDLKDIVIQFECANAKHRRMKIEA